MPLRIWTNSPRKLTAIPCCNESWRPCTERLGDVRGQAYGASLGDRAGATESYRKALQIREALAQNSPRDLQSRSELAGIYSKLGIELEDTSEAARGLEYLQKSLAVYTELLLKRRTIGRLKQI